MEDFIQAIFWNGDVNKYFLGHQFEEIFKSRIYAPYLENKKDSVVLDIGAHIGIFTLYAYEYSKRIYAVEPSLEHFDLLVRMISHNKMINVVPIRKAIYIENKKLPFGGPDSNKTMRSLHTAIWQEGKPRETVEAITLDTLFKDNNIEHIDLMKLDVEGSEYEILAGEGFRKVADKIDVIVGETHSWADRHPNQLRESLKNNGFKVETIKHDANLFVATKI